LLSVGGHSRGGSSEDSRRWQARDEIDHRLESGGLYRRVVRGNYRQYHPGYRPDIDGLRALAVLPVVLYHAGLGFPGGFVGVDVFFVISGYLITSLISKAMQEGRFSILSFYERRARRILPALLAVLVASTAAAFLLFMPPDFAMFGRSAVATALFVSNMHFASEAGYFDAASSVKPLLHTWSLAVEEQFYIFFPLLLLAIQRWMAPIRLLILSVLVTGSLALDLWLTGRATVEAFFLSPPRFWEIGLGSLLALAPCLILRPLFAAATALVGAALIGAALFAISGRTAFPGAWALLPCVGTALIIAAGISPNPVSRVLSVGPLVFIGLISYSLYLWHWPLIVFVQYAQGRPLDETQAVVVVSVSLVLAAMSWWLVELPIRRRTLFTDRKALLRAACGTIAMICVVGATIDVADGLPGRLPSDVQAIYAAREDKGPFIATTCFADGSSGPTDADVRAGRLCQVGSTGAGRIKFIVWGDSHAGAMAPAIDAAAKDYRQKGLFAGRATCPPLIDYQDVSGHQEKRDACVVYNAAVLDLIKASHVSQAFLIARWPREVLGTEYGREGIFFDPNAPHATSDRSIYVSEALDRTLAALSNLGVHTVLVMDVPEPGYDVPYWMAKAALHHHASTLDPSRKAVEERRSQALAILRAAAQKFRADLIDPATDFCDQERCRVESNGIPLYMDADHLTRTAAIGLRHFYDPIFAARRAAPPAAEPPASQ